MFEKLKKSKKFDLLMDLKKNGIFDKSVLNAIEIIDRSLFVDENLKQKSNLNIALPIDCGQTISQPLVVAHMTQSLNLNNKLRVLEVGTGSGYQSLILSKLSRFVYTVERYSSLKKKAEMLLKELGVKNVFFKHADGGLGWNEQSPFDRIIVTANAPEIPNKLVEQLVNDGIMIIPVGDDYNQQILKKVVKKGNKILVENLMQVRFVPLIEGKLNK
ncbi:MAG: protein-L-isoaspartate O-methyltransferase [Alphaproteobacteria bacterium]|nr:protein-L-isoaspartate O-methyltransferase [Alphaproteobacteria bacterium]